MKIYRQWDREVLDKLRETYPSIPEAKYVSVDGFTIDLADGKLGLLTMQYQILVDPTIVLAAMTEPFEANK